MELSDLKNKILSTFEGDKNQLTKIIDMIDKDHSIFPFNQYEHLLHNLINIRGLTFEQYNEIRSEYIRSNPNLWIFEISAPRGFGEGFAQTYVGAMCRELQKPSKSLDPHYNGEYDFWLEGVKIEVKASRVVDRDSDEPLYMKALSSDTDRPFLMNFQQLKPSCCDVFIWIAVFRDEITVWVINSDTVQNHPLFSRGQHRGNHGNEGQMHITNENISQLDHFRLKTSDLKTAVLNCASP
ncbi:MAG: hypothetical protein RBR86_00490 [Pseudobdellovibrionaceae bacterium]|jgi:hypothetical protein|nr:hypothetical protein [Pseudobdellovibrionaceae bacterium]